MDLEQVRQGWEEEMNYRSVWFLARSDFSDRDEMHRPIKEGRRRSTTCAARFQTSTRGSEGGLVRGDATVGGKESAVCMRCRGA